MLRQINLSSYEVVTITEKWKIYTFGNLQYNISNYGVIIGLGRGREIKSRLDKDGYLIVTLGDINNRCVKKVHRIVAELFCDNTNNFNEVNHIDLNRSNPRADNLEWTTHRDNVHHSHRMGSYKNLSRGENNPRSKLTEQQVLEIRRLYSNGLTQNELSKIFNVGWSTVHNIVFNLTWKHLI